MTIFNVNVVLTYARFVAFQNETRLLFWKNVMFGAVPSVNSSTNAVKTRLCETFALVYKLSACSSLPSHSATLCYVVVLLLTHWEKVEVLVVLR